MRWVLKYDIEDLRRLRRQAAKGDKSALNKLYNENTRLAKIANQRMLKLEKAGKAYYAYDRAAHYVDTMYGRRRFSTSSEVLTTPHQLFDQLTELSLFLGRRTSLVSEQIKIEDERLATLEKDRGYTFKDRETGVAFLRFLGDKPVANLVERKGEKYSGDITDVIYEAFQREDFDTSEALRKFEAFNADRLTYDKLIEYLTPDELTINTE